MKKIVLFVFMIIASVNLFSKEIPDDIILDYETALDLYNLVIEDAKNDGFNMENESVYKSHVKDDIFGYVFYQMIIYDSENRGVNIFHEEKIYSLLICRDETIQDYFFTVGIIEVCNKEDILLYSIRFFEEDDVIIFEGFYDHITNEYYTNNKYE